MTAPQPELSPMFREFLVEAKLNGYGSEDVVKTRLESGANEIVFEQDDWRYTDNYIGGNPYAGYESVAVKQADELWLPVWGMAYKSKPLDPELDGATLGGLLGEFLSQPDPTLPIRGPLNAWDKSKSYRYRLTHSFSSNLEDFEAGEQITRRQGESDRILYSARFLGGLANSDNTNSRSNKPWLV